MMRLAIAALLGLVSQVPASPAAATATGRVLDERTRTPILQAKVTLMPSTEQRRATPFIRPTVVLTDADGRFVLMGIAPGPHTVQVTAAGYVGGSAGVTATAAMGAPSNHVEVVLRPGGVLRGRVLDADGAPVDRAIVYAQRRVEQGRVGTPVAGALTPGVSGPRLVSIGAPARTDVLGAFTLEAVETGPYYVRVTAASSQDRETSPGSGITSKALPTYYPGTIEPEAALPVAARAGESTEVGDIRLQFAAAFRITGIVVDEAGQPVEHVRVRLVPSDAPHGALPATGIRADTGAGGEFRLSSVLQGQYLLVAVPPVLVRHDALPDARGRYTTSFVLGGATPEAARGSVTTETSDGTTRQFRDELGATVPVDVSYGSVFDVRVIVRRR